MKRIIGLFLLFAATAVLAQDKNPVTSVAKQILPRQQKNLVAAVEEMPADKFGYKPTEQQMTFGHLVLHIIESNNYLCSHIGDVPEVKPPVALKESDGKDKLVAALQASFAEVVRRHDPDFAAFHRKLSDAGKPKKLIRVALARKLLVRLNAKARDALADSPINA